MDHGGGAQGHRREHPPDPGDVEQRHPDESDVAGDIGPGRVDRRQRLPGDIGVGEHGPLGVSGGARGVHDQRRAVAGDVDDRGRVAVLGDEVLVTENAVGSGRCLGDDHRGQHRSEFANRHSERCQHRFGDDDFGSAVFRDVGQFRLGEPEVDRNRDGAQSIRGQRGLDELRAIEHQDHHPVTDADTAPVQGAGQRGDPVCKAGPGDGSALEPQRGRRRLHQSMTLELGDPVLPAG